jgi:sugar phosphate isomerase/epimerase
MKPGCSTILYGSYDLDTALKGIADAGYSAIELCSIPGMGEHFSPEMSQAELAGIKSRIADHGLVIESIGASSNLMDPERRARFVWLMKATAVLGAPAITSGSGGVSDDEKSFAEVVRVFTDELTPVAKDTGVKLAIKPHVNAAVYNTPTALRFMQEVDTDWVGLNPDASHLWRANEMPEETMPQLMPYCFTGRIRDNRASREIPIGSVDGQRPGRGAMNLPAICAVWKTSSLDYLTLEIVGTKEMPLTEVQEIVEDAYRYLSPLIE